MQLLARFASERALFHVTMCFVTAAACRPRLDSCETDERSRTFEVQSGDMIDMDISL